MLILVKISGTTVNGAQRWLNLGPLNLQPSEFAKPAVAMLLAAVFSKDTVIMDNYTVDGADIINEWLYETKDFERCSIEDLYNKVSRWAKD